MTNLSNRTVASIVTTLWLLTPMSWAASATNTIIVFNDNGGWCWFQDERAVVVGGTLVFGSVANRLGTDGANRGGNIEVTAVDLEGGASPVTTVLHDRLEDDDHDAPALLVLEDGRLLAVYARHGTDRFVRVRVSTNPRDITSWEAENRIERQAGVTYSNLFLLPTAADGQPRIYDFYRGEHWNPNWIVSNDLGQSWRYGGRLVAFDGRPYVKYVSNNIDTIHFITTEHHPHNYNNSLYHAYIKAGAIYRSDGTRICDLEDAPIQPTQATTVFAGDADHVAWPCDMHLGAHGHPCVAYSVQKQRIPDGIHYRYAKWNAKAWDDHFLAHAGTALYTGEEHYTGLVALDPADPNHLYISTDANPVTARPLISKNDGQRHYEIFEGRTGDGGATWRWQPVTQDSVSDNIRPIVPAGQGSHRILLWLRGTYTSYTKYDLDVVGIIDKVARQ